VKPRKLSYESQERLWELLRVIYEVIEKDKPFDIGKVSIDAFGYAARDTWFNSQGFYWTGYIVKEYMSGLYDVDAIRSFFNLTRYKLADLYHPLRFPNGHETTAQEVADRLEKWLRECEKL
jgi:hypothetical protein